MPRTDLPRITLGVTFSEDQCARMEEMLAQFNATRGELAPMRNYEELIASGLIALESLLFHITDDAHRSVFERQP